MRAVEGTVRAFTCDELEPPGETCRGATADRSDGFNTKPQAGSGELQLRREELEVPQLERVFSPSSDVLHDGGGRGQQDLLALLAFP